MSAAGALGYLGSRTLANRARTMAARVRRPRYALALLAGVGYFAFIFWTGTRNGSSGDAGVPPWMGTVAPLGLAMLAGLWWMVGGYERALAFTPAEVHFLFTAPVRRATLIRYKLARAQVGVLGTILIVLFFAPGGELDWTLRVPALWIVVTTLYLHQVGASLVRAEALRQGAAGLRRVWPVILVVGLALAGVGWTLVSAWEEIRTAATGGEALVRFVEALDRPVASTVLLPFRLLLAPLLAVTPAEWLRALPGGLVLLGAHYLWVIRSDASFEEASAEAGARRAEQMEAFRQGRAVRVAWSRRSGERTSRPSRGASLAPEGAPWMALVWKNLQAGRAGARRSTVLVLVFGLGSVWVLVAATEGLRQANTALGVMCGVFAALLLLLGPLLLRFDLRQDLTRAGLLLTYPLRGSQVVGAELVATTLILTLAQVVLLALGAAVIPFGEAEPGSWRWFLLAAVVGAVVLPGVNALAVGVQNGLAVLLPDWVRLGKASTAGIEQMGHNILMLLVTILFVGLGLLPPLFTGGIVTLILWPVLGPWGIAPGLLAGLALLWGEVALGVLWIGQAFEGLDPTEVGLVH